MRHKTRQAARKTASVRKISLVLPEMCKSASFLFLFYVVYPAEKSVPTYFAVKQTVVLVERNPHHERLAHYVVFGNESPETRIGGAVAVVAHHPVIVHFECVGVGLLSVYVNIPVAQLEFVVLINPYGTLVEGIIVFVQTYCGSAFGNPNRSVVMCCPIFHHVERIKSV